jgi:hypothetical protein
VQAKFSLICFLAGCHFSASALAGISTELESQPKLREFIAQLPIAFEENKGQVNPSVKFLARAPGYQIFLTERDAVIVLSNDRPGSLPAHSVEKTPLRNLNTVVKMQWSGASKGAKISGVEPLPYKTNYLRGSDSSAHIVGAQSHRQVKYESIYPGVDLVYYGNQHQLEYDLRLAPYAKSNQIRLRYKGVDHTSLTPEGALSLATASGKLSFLKPIAYQDIGGERRKVDASYTLAKNGEVGFKIGHYDESKPLVIDPILSYSSFLWGTEVTGIAVDIYGNAYVVGYIQSTDMPSTAGYQRTLAGTIDAFVMKIDPSGKNLVYSTYLGARRATTFGKNIAIDPAGNAYITGKTDSASFPVTAGTYQSVFATGASFVTKLNSSGSALSYSTFVNGSSISAISVDNSGNAYLAGEIKSITTSPGAFHPTNANSAYFAPFVAKLNSTGNATLYATYLCDGGTTEGIRGMAVDQAGNAHLTGVSVGCIPSVNAIQPAMRGGYDAFVTKLNSSGTALVYSTYLGGQADDFGNAIAVDAWGTVAVGGMTYSDNFPVTAGALQANKGYAHASVSNAFVTRINSAGTALEFSTYFGGRWCLKAGVNSCLIIGSDGIESATAIAIDEAGYVLVGGFATSAEFPQKDPIQAISAGGDEWRSPFVAKFRPDGKALAYSVVLGGRGQNQRLNGLAVDVAGNAYAVGMNGSTSNYPVTGGALRSTGSAYIFKLSTGKYPTTLQSSANPSVAGQTIVLTANVLSTIYGGVVNFTAGDTVLGTASVNDGTASIAVTLPAGVHKISASYSGDGKVSPLFLQTVNP